MDGSRVTEQEWDAVVVGTGMGGATLGHALSCAGWRVLFVEMGRSSLQDAPALRGGYVEMASRERPPGGAELAAAGRFPEAIRDLSAPRERAFIPFIGSGTGGSSALYGMVLERFFPADFEPARCHPGVEGSTLPERWPISYQDLVPYYEAAERLYGVRGVGDGLRPDSRYGYVAPPPALSPSAEALASRLREKGLHPYPLPLACAQVAGCSGCQGYLCPKACKVDSASACLTPALALGAQLVDECRVVQVVADRKRVTELVCRRKGELLRLRGRTVVLAAGALATPSLLLGSRSELWPEGVANGSGHVGHHLMRHFIDLYAVFAGRRAGQGGNAKEIGCNDLYMTPHGKFGALQSFGDLPPAAMIVEDLQRDLRDTVHPLAAQAFRVVKPLLRPVMDGMFARATILASVMEDLPTRDNRVLSPDSGGAISIRYRVSPAEARRIAALRKRIGTLLKPLPYLLIKQAENNQRIAHACGTCRFGDDPASSVLDRNNRAHELENLYVVDASFFPSSAGTNPALTIAANALRVADVLTGRIVAGGAT